MDASSCTWLSFPTMSEIRGPSLPAEIVDQVLKNLDRDEDRGALCDCGLVSRTWLALSRSILFSSIAVRRGISPYHDRLLEVHQGATIRPYVRSVRVCVNPTAKWTINHLSNFLAQFPELSTLRLTEDWWLAIRAKMYTQLDRSRNEPSPGSGIVARLRRAFTKPPRFTRRKACGPFIVQEPLAPLAQLRTVHVEYPPVQCPRPSPPRTSRADHPPSHLARIRPWSARRACMSLCRRHRPSHAHPVVPVAPTHRAAVDASAAARTAHAPSPGRRLPQITLEWHARIHVHAHAHITRCAPARMRASPTTAGRAAN